jgi:hypothetical protein
MSRARPAVVIAAIAVAIAAVIVVAVINVVGATPRALRTPNLSSIASSRQAPKIPAHGAYIGAWVRPELYDQASRIAAVDGLQSQLGRRLAIVHAYLTWRGAFPTQSDLAALRQGSMLLLSWTGTNSSAVASGAYDSFIRQRARAIKATGKPVFLEWRWEMNRSNLSGVVGSPAEFIAAWRHVRAIFAQQHVDNVAWVWCPTAQGFAPGGNAPAYYPGNAEVDLICADAYPGFGPYQPFASTVQSFLRWASHHPKPVMIGEYGVPLSYPPRQRAQWLRASAQTVQADPQIKAVVYFDADPIGSVASDSFGLAGHTPALQEFRAIADSRYFNPGDARLSG